MADTRGIDRVFDLVDNLVDKADRVLNRTKYTEEQHRARRAKHSDVIDADANDVKTPSKVTAIAKRPRFYIVEAIAAESGTKIFIVTDGGSARAECSTIELAQKIQRALEASP